MGHVVAPSTPSVSVVFPACSVSSRCHAARPKVLSPIRGSLYVGVGVGSGRQSGFPGRVWVWRAAPACSACCFCRGSQRAHPCVFAVCSQWPAWHNAVLSPWLPNVTRLHVSWQCASAQTRAASLAHTRVCLHDVRACSQLPALVALLWWHAAQPRVGLPLAQALLDCTFFSSSNPVRGVCAAVLRESAG